MDRGQAGRQHHLSYERFRNRDPVASRAGDSASEVQATTAIRAVRNIDQLIMLANMQMAPYILQVSLRVELVKMGSDVLPESAHSP